MSQNDLTVQTVIDIVSADDRINWADADIRVLLRGRTVVLSGKVGRLADKRRAGDDVLKVKGIDSVENNLLVETAPARTDKDIHRHVVDALEQDPWIDHTRIRVSIDKGIVTLEGEAESLLRKRLIGATIWWVPGVREVVDNLIVAHPEPDGDEQLVDACATVLEKDPFVDASEVLVRVRNGVVTLLGSVCNEGEKEMAENDCWYVSGVKEVVNRLTVVPGGGMERPAP